MKHSIHFLGPAGINLQHNPPLASSASVSPFTNCEDKRNQPDPDHGKPEGYIDDERIFSHVDLRNSEIITTALLLSVNDNCKRSNRQYKNDNRTENIKLNKRIYVHYSIEKIKKLNDLQNINLLVFPISELKQSIKYYGKRENQNGTNKINNHKILIRSHTDLRSKIIPNNQRNTAIINPINAESKLFEAPVNNGTKRDAKNTWPISRQTSDKPLKTIHNSLRLIGAYPTTLETNTAIQP